MVLDTYNTYTYNACSSLKLVIEVCDVKTAYIRPHCVNVLVGYGLTLDPRSKVVLHTFNALYLLCNWSQS